MSEQREGCVSCTGGAAGETECGDLESRAVDDRVSPSPSSLVLEEVDRVGAFGRMDDRHRTWLLTTEDGTL